MKKVGLFIGTFNPIHVGHLMMYQQIKNMELFDEVRITPSPESPNKIGKECASFDDRCWMVQLCNVYCETRWKDLPTPSRTIDLLDYLKSKEQDSEFTIIMGIDNWNDIPNWKESERLVNENKFFIYGIEHIECHYFPENMENTMFRPMTVRTNLHSSFIRKEFKEGRSIYHYVHQEVARYMFNERLYIDWKSTNSLT
jgi:nicotinate-nucleotide adenylyltransferase